MKQFRAHLAAFALLPLAFTACLGDLDMSDQAGDWEVARTEQTVSVCGDEVQGFWYTVNILAGAFGGGSQTVTAFTSINNILRYFTCGNEMEALIATMEAIAHSVVDQALRDQLVDNVHALGLLIDSNTDTTAGDYSFYAGTAQLRESDGRSLGFEALPVVVSLAATKYTMWVGKYEKLQDPAAKVAAQRQLWAGAAYSLEGFELLAQDLEDHLDATIEHGDTGGGVLDRYVRGWARLGDGPKSYTAYFDCEPLYRNTIFDCDDALEQARNAVPPLEAAIAQETRDHVLDADYRDVRDKLRRPPAGLYRIRVEATGRPLHEHGAGDRLVSTRWDFDDDYSHFYLEPQGDGSYRIRVKATGHYFHEDGAGDRLVSTRWDVDDDYTRFTLERLD